jgi:hypothetical protein
MNCLRKPPEFNAESTYKITKEIDLILTDIVNKKKYKRRMYFLGLLSSETSNIFFICKSSGTQYALYTLHTDLIDDKNIKEITQSIAFDMDIGGLFNLVLFNSRIVPRRYEVE